MEKCKKKLRIQNIESAWGLIVSSHKAESELWRKGKINFEISKDELCASGKKVVQEVKENGNERKKTWKELVLSSLESVE